MITIVSNSQGDWIGFYLDGKLIEEGHSFETSQLLQLAGVEHTMIRALDMEEINWSRLPPDLLDVPHATATLVKP